MNSTLLQEKRKSPFLFSSYKADNRIMFFSSDRLIDWFKMISYLAAIKGTDAAPFFTTIF